MNSKTQSRAEIDDFLRRFRRSLATLPSDIRDDLVEEVRSHLEERGQQGQLDLATDFGSPEEYALGFVSEQVLHTAVVRGRPWDLFAALLGTLRTTAISIFVVLPLAVLELVAVALVVIGFLKPLASNHIGLFRQADESFGGLGWMSNTTAMHEVLGMAAMPLFIFAGLLLFWIGYRLMMTVAQRELLKIRSARTDFMEQK